MAAREYNNAAGWGRGSNRYVLYVRFDGTFANVISSTLTVGFVIISSQKTERTS